jgi:hypothetical protein
VFFTYAKHKDHLINYVRWTNTLMYWEESWKITSFSYCMYTYDYWC